MGALDLCILTWECSVPLEIHLGLTLLATKYILSSEVNIDLALGCGCANLGEGEEMWKCAF